MDHSALSPATAIATPTKQFETQAARNVERARIAFLTRRLPIDPNLAAAVASIMFGEARS